MSRRFKPLDSVRIPDLPSCCAGCVFWESEAPLPKRCDAACDSGTLAGWIDYVRAQWGDCGRVALEDGAVLGFVKYAPAAFFPQVAHMSAGPPHDDAVLLACLHVNEETRSAGLGKLLLHAAMRDLAQRGERTLEAYGAHVLGDRRQLPVAGVDFLLKASFTVARPDPRYPLLRLELKSLVSWTENLEAVLESLHLGRVPGTVPAPR
jgi:GNAT superfamily N-acetyltransferase